MRVSDNSVMSSEPEMRVTPRRVRDGTDGGTRQYIFGVDVRGGGGSLEVGGWGAVGATIGRRPNRGEPTSILIATMKGVQIISGAPQSGPGGGAPPESEQAEKRQITLVSLAAAAILTSFKVAVGLF